MIQRMLAAARLDVDFFEDVESDMSLTGQAMLVVLIASIAGGIGAIGGEGIGAFFLGVIAWIVFWAVLAFVTYFVGTTIFNTPQTYANWGQMARVIGYAQSPGILRIFGFIPGIGWWNHINRLSMANCRHYSRSTPSVGLRVNLESGWSCHCVRHPRAGYFLHHHASNWRVRIVLLRSEEVSL